MQNPFKYGELAEADNFCNRTKEVKRLHAAFRDGQSVVLISPRRWGKSSLVSHALATYKGKHLAVKLDCFGLSSPLEFHEALLKNVLAATSTKMQQAADTLLKLAKSLAPFVRYSVSEGGSGAGFPEFNVSLDFPKNKIDPSEVLDLANRIARDRHVRIIVCIDEFQQIAEWNGGEKLYETLRSHWQKHIDVSYILYGSKRHIMKDLFSQTSRPFYRFGETIFLEKIDASEWVAFLLREFRRTGKKIEKSNAAHLVSKVDSHSYFVQYLARICWNNSQKEVTREIVEEGFAELLNDHLGIFQQLTRNLSSYQINYLRALVAGETQLTSQRVLETYNLGSAPNIKRNERTFEDLEVLDFSMPDQPVFCDPYFVPLFMKYFVRN